uniref:Specifically androgen-regulated gene protein n=1 Tax=Poecilia latipinna TaxID=48699 RepID=A0A3B3V6S1_9TELE
MSKSGTWPGNVAMESLSNMDSAGSCDSVISTNSDSMEYLSAEEKACLMFLEETIEALEVQEDSGLSNDEPDVWSKTEPQDQIRSNDVPTEKLESGSLRISTLTPHTTADPPSAGLTTECETEHHAANQNYNPQSASTSAVGMKDVETEDLGVETDPSVSNSGYTTSSSDKTTDVSKFDGDLELENVTNSGDASENDLDIIPPPTDFRDEPEPDLPPEAMTVVLPPETMTMVLPPETMTVEATTVVLPPEATAIVSPPSNDFTEQKRTVDVEQMRLRASPSEPRNPPAVAPKPKKLPSNIILKSPKSPTLASHGNPGHSVPSHSDRMLLDPQKVRMEALLKLGLLKDNKEESSRAVSPKLPPKSAAYKRSLASPSPPVSPAPHTPPVTPSLTPVISDELPAVTEATFSTLMKFATLERSGLGLSSQMSNLSLLEMAGGEQDPKHLRNTRPRPASLGTGKDFNHPKGEGLVASGTSESQKPQPTQAFHHRESSKLPRSQGISVMICPRPENEEDRRKALKKLGLLRD